MRVTTKRQVTIPQHFRDRGQAAIFEMNLITRDPSRYRTYFPTVQLISPKMM